MIKCFICLLVLCKVVQAGPCQGIVYNKENRMAVLVAHCGKEQLKALPEDCTGVHFDITRPRCSECQRRGLTVAEANVVGVFPRFVCS